MRFGPWLVCVVVGIALGGCAPTFTERAVHGITFYAPGAGNVDFGDAGLREGLEAAGYKGQVATLLWTVTFNPALDQAIRLNAHFGAAELARQIQAYIDKFPGRQVNLVGLSAGTGVVMWALENLKRGYAVDNVVLLSSSLSNDYDVSKALSHVKNRIHNYYSDQDMILAGPMKLWGTIDFRFGVEGAGSVGLHPASGADRVTNVRWTREFEKFGYYGGHTDSTSPQFVRAYIARDLSVSAPATETTVARSPAEATPAAPSDPPSPAASH